MKQETEKNKYLFLEDGGEMGEMIKSYDWSTSVLGTPDQWPQSLCTTLGIILHSAFPMFLFWGKDLICFYNDAFRPSLGIDGKHPAIGKKGMEVWDDIWEFVGPMINGVMETGKPVYFEDQLIGYYRNGKKEDIYWTFSYSPAYGDNNKISGVFVTCTETTQNVKTIKALGESELRFRTMAENTGVLIATSDETSNATYFNKAWTDFTGRSMNELLHFGWADLVHDDDRQDFLDLYLNAFKKQESWMGQFRMLNKAGEYRWLLAKGPVRKGADDSFAGYISSSIDITDQVDALKRTKESEQDLRSLVLQAPIGICVLDAASLVCEIVNDSFVEIAGKPYEDIAGQFYWDTFAEARPYYEEALNNVVKDGVPYHANEVELMLIRHGKEEKVYVTFVYAPLKDAAGNVTKITVWVLENTQQVTSRQKVERGEAEMRSLVEAAPFAIGVYRGREMRVALANKAIMDIWGKGTDVIGKLFSEVLPELDNQEVFKQLDEVYRTGIAFHIKNQPLDLIVDGKRHKYYFNYSLTPLFDAEGNVYGIMNTGVDLTELNLAKRKVEQSERNFRNIVLHAPVAMCILLGPTFIVEVANQFMIELWGKQAEDVMSKPIFVGLPDAREQGLEGFLLNVYQTGEAFRAEEMPVSLLRFGKEEIVYQNFAYEPYKDTEGTIIGILAISIDVTPQVLARKKIEEAQEKARLAINSAELGVYEIDYLSNEMNTDDRFKEIWGVDHSATREHYAAAIHPDDIAHREEAHLLSLKSGHLNYQARVLWKDKSTHWVKISGKVTYDQQNKPVRLIGIIQDVTDIALAQNKIEESEKNIRNMVLQAPVAMCIFRGESYTVEIANNMMIELWGKQAVEVLNKPIFEGLPEAKQQGLEQLLLHVYTSGEKIVANERPVDLPRNGKIETTYLNFVYEALRNGDGSISGILAVAIDVTAQVLARQKIEEVVAERTKELASANNDLQKSNAELAQFAYIASHDLQEPLRKIGTFSQMLEKSLGNSLSDHSKNYFNKIQVSTNRMNLLIRDVLAYSEVTKDHELFKTVDLNKIFENTKADYDLLIEQTGATITCNNLPVLEAIPLQMSQLFSNLVGNSLKFIRTGERPVITVVSSKLTSQEKKDHSLSQAMEYYNIQFTDNGVGFKPELTDRIFNIFQRLHRKSEFEGTGIGLALCKKIVLNHHGEINAMGSSENGAVFNVILPQQQV